MSVASDALTILRHAWRMTRRDWRAGELRFLLAALAVAVAALSAVGFFVDRMNAALERDATELLGADLLVRSDYPVREAWRAEAAVRGLLSADVVSFPSMATTGSAETEDTRLVAVKAVSSAYPLRGDLRLRTKNAELTTKGAPQAGTVWVDTALLSLRGLRLGDAMTLGERRFTIAAEILLEKDRGAGFMNFAPRVMLALQDLESTGLVQNGSRITYRLQLAGNSLDVTSFQRWLENDIKINEVRGVQIESLESGRPEMRTTLERARQFLSLVSLLTAMLAALAIAMASRRFMQRHLDAVAMLRCLGLRQSDVTRIYLIEFILIGTVGGLLGAAIGFGAHFLLLEWLGSLMTTRLPPPGWMPLVQGVATGLLLLLGFAIPPVLQLRNVPHNRVIRREQDPPKAFTVSGYLLALASFMGLLLWQARDLRLGLLTSGGFIVLLAVSFLAGWLLLRLLQSARVPPGWPAWRFAQTSLKRRPAATVLQIVALSLGLMALLLLTVVRQDLVAAWRQSSPPDAPNHFIINIQPDQQEAVAQELTQNGIADVNLAPMIRGRLLQVDGRNISSATYTEERAQRLIEREFNLSTLTELPAHNTITDGRWFDTAQPEASVEQGLAKTLGLKLGDLLRFDVGGQSVDVKITSLRKLDWGSMRVNFFVILNPAAAQNLPATYITAFHLPATQQTLVNQLVRHYPNLTIVDVGSMVVQVQQVIDQVIAAVEFLFLFTLVSGVMVLAAAMLISQNERAHEAGLLRALGATRRELSRAQWVECLLVGTAAGLLAASGASLVGWVLAHQVFEFEWQFSPLVWVIGIAAGVVCAFSGGWFGLRNVLSRPPIETLREA
ncbi:MAG: FtsX-like permease family protein [Oxalobacteraceae bacterium]|nr:FtsX-like permease family protein [Oxalobacteraceae bacterium]